MTAAPKGRGPFFVKDCALASIATGVRVQNLKELRDQVVSVHPGCLFNHFWGSLLAPRFEERTYHNDFAAWAADGLHDLVLAERLAMIDPADHRSLEGLRQEVVEVLEERLDEREHVPWARLDQQFHFVRAQVIVFDARRSIARPEDLPMAFSTISLGSIFYHVVDARRLTADGRDDFRVWLESWGAPYVTLAERIARVDPHILRLAELRQRLALMFADYFGAGHHASPPG